jgi:hypothetical protein
MGQIVEEHCEMFLLSAKSIVKLFKNFNHT